VTERAVPILPSANLRETLAFYQRLGFENRSEGSGLDSAHVDKVGISHVEMLRFKT
jgi:hypothetical protein